VVVSSFIIETVFARYAGSTERKRSICSKISMVLFVEIVINPYNLLIVSVDAP